jgi:hypothetical protein
MANTSYRPKFFIGYGWISGRSHGRTLRNLLTQSGYQEVDVARDADIVVTHSAGLYLIPSTARPKILLLVGPTLAPLRFSTWARVNLENAKMFIRDGNVLRGIWLNMLHLVSVFTRPIHNLKIARATKKATFDPIPDCQIILLANKDDLWPKLPDWDTFMTENTWAFVSMPGAHENIWEQPEEYVKLINHYAKRLLAQTRK